VVPYSYSTVTDLMFPTQTKLKLIPILEFTSKVSLKKGIILSQKYLDFRIGVFKIL
jgi:hypothetical protein